MNHQPGFSVIEFVISIMITAMLMTASLTIYQQISRGAVRVQTTTTQDTTCLIIQQRLSSDLLGLCPLWFTQDQAEQFTKSNQPKSDPTQEQPKSPQSQPASQDPELKKNNFFYAQSINQQLDCLTFISTSVLKSFDTAKYQCARIVYILKQDPDNQNLFILQRKEDPTISNQFTIQTLKQGHFYTVAKNITQCVVEYGFVNVSPEQQEKQTDLEWKLKWTHQWGIVEEKQNTNEYLPQLPELLKIKISLQEKPDAPITTKEIYCHLPNSKNISIQSFAEKNYLAKRNQPQAPKEPTNSTQPDVTTNNDQTTIIPVIPKST